MTIESKTVFASIATSFLALCVVFFVMRGDQSSGPKVAMLIGLPVLSAVALKVALGDRLAGWPYVLIPALGVLLFVAIGVALLIYSTFSIWA